MKRIKKLKNLPKNIFYDQMSSPVGLLTLFASSRGIHFILWEEESNTDACKNILKHLENKKQHTIITETKCQLNEYFSGTRKIFNLPLCLEGTPFQIQAWKELYKIPYGCTISYGEQASRLGEKNKARAIGLANGMNPISIIVPCHRVVGSDGHLTGFGGGLEIKSLLLRLEKDNQ